MRLKAERNAVILAHNYMRPEIFHGISDIVGDSLALAREATTVEADVIVLAGVHFMAETAKLLNPSKTVLIPDLRSGCSLAESITAEDVRASWLRSLDPADPSPLAPLLGAIESYGAAQDFMLPREAQDDGQCARRPDATKRDHQRVPILSVLPSGPPIPNPLDHTL